MIEIRRILCPIDFSDASRQALEHAVALATWYEARITALHVAGPAFLPEPPILFADFPGRSGADPTDRQAIEAQLDAWLAPALAAGAETEAIVEEGGRPAQSILQHARSLPADVIALGTHGRGGAERVLMGSVAEQVLRKAACPVLTVPPAAVRAATLPYKRLLCPVDFSESSLAALEFALSIAQESDAHLTVLHVFNWPPEEELLVEQFDTPEFRQLVEERARRRLDALVPEAARTWCEPETRISYGKPYRQILEIAGSEEADLILIGVRGRNPLDLMLFGSTANHVVRRASCPVLTVKR